MADFTLGATIEMPYDLAVSRVRELLAEAGFGVLTEIDVQATLHARLGMTTAPRIILGACRPQLAHRAIEADPRTATLLPCNVVVTDEGAQRTRIEALDPAFITSLSDDPDLSDVAGDARERLIGMFAALTGTTEDTHAARP